MRAAARYRKGHTRFGVRGIRRSFHLPFPIFETPDSHATSGIRILRQSKDGLILSRGWIVGLFGNTSYCVYDVGSGNVRHIHQPPDQRPIWPIKFLFELLPEPEISGCGHEGVGRCRSINGFCYLPDTRLLLNNQGSSQPVPDSKNTRCTTR